MNRFPQLISRLQAAESTVNSLTKQVTDLTSSDTLSRIRDNYSQAMSAAAYEHKQELLSVQEEVDHHRHQLEEKVFYIYWGHLISRVKQKTNYM